MSRLIFSEIKNDTDLASYLTLVLSRATKTSCLYHYTTFSTLKKIIEGQILLLNKPSRMNDKAEADAIKLNGLKDKLFYSCFTMSNESAELWNMYTEVNDGCLIEIPFDLAKEMKNYTVLRFTDELKKLCVQTGTPIQEKISFNSVAYYSTNPKNNYPSLSCMSVFNKGYSQFYQSKKLAGMIKSDFWRFEHEARMIVRLQDIWEGNFLGLSLDTQFWDKCKVVISPFSTSQKEIEIADYCKKNSINCRRSSFSGQISFEGRLFDSENTRKYISQSFNKTFGNIEAGTRKLSYGDLMTTVIIQELKKWRSTYSSIVEYKESLFDEVASMLKDFDRKQIEQWISSIINYLQ